MINAYWTISIVLKTEEMVSIFLFLKTNKGLQRGKLLMWFSDLNHRVVQRGLKFPSRKNRDLQCSSCHYKSHVT